MANKNIFRRYSRTSVRDKKNLVRSLNSFTKQYKFTFIEKVRLNKDRQIEFGKLMGLSFSQTNEKPLGVDGESGLIYSSEIANNDLSDYGLILEAIDNLISINTKFAYKEALKSILEKYSDDEISFMLAQTNETKVISEIKRKFECSSVYAKRIYNQLKNRIQYRYVGLYSENNLITQNINTLAPQFLTSYDISKSNIAFILKRERLFSETILNELRNKLGLNENISYTTDNSSQPYYEDLYDNLLMSVANHFNVEFCYYDMEELEYEFEDGEDMYLDAIDILIYTFLEEENDNSRYPNPDYVPYTYTFRTEYAQEHFLDIEHTCSYLKYYYEEMWAGDQVDEREKVENKQEEWYARSLLHPSEEETYNDTSLKDEVRASAGSLYIQWNDFYEELLCGIQSERKEDNVYYTLHIYANELVSQFSILEEHNIFLENGSIDEYCSYLQDLRKELLNELKDVEYKVKEETVSKMLTMKRKEWRLLYKNVYENKNMYMLACFDYEKLIV